MKGYVAGNWKMNHGPAETERFFRELLAEKVFGEISGGGGPEIVVFPPALSFAAARSALPVGSPVALGAQSVHWEVSGAFTGEVSAEMAREAGAGYVLVGHSERRHVFHETDEETRLKVMAAQRVGLVPVLCVGERIEERAAGRLEEVLLRQLDAVLAAPEIGDRVRSGDPLLLAYEPVWAIGTGETATPADASEAHGILRARSGELLTPDRAGEVPILYGGSVSPENASGLLGAPEVNGVLVGGASLRADSFAAVVGAALA